MTELETLCAAAMAAKDAYMVLAMQQEPMNVADRVAADIARQRAMNEHIRTEDVYKKALQAELAK